jgi:hypothetical protein
MARRRTAQTSTIRLALGVIALVYTVAFVSGVLAELLRG